MYAYSKVHLWFTLNEFNSQPCGSYIAISGSVKSNSVVNDSQPQRRLRRCVAQVLSRGVGLATSYTLQRNTANIIKV